MVEDGLRVAPGEVLAVRQLLLVKRLARHVAVLRDIKRGIELDQGLVEPPGGFVDSRGFEHPVDRAFLRRLMVLPPGPKPSHNDDRCDGDAQR